MENFNVAVSGSNTAQWKERVLHGGASQREQIDQVAKEFEGILVRQFLDQAFKPIDGQGGFFGMESSPMQEQMIKDALATSITQGTSLGFSSVLQAQLMSGIEKSNPE